MNAQANQPQELAAVCDTHNLWRSKFLKAVADNHVARPDYQSFFSSYAPSLLSVDRLVASVMTRCEDTALRGQLADAFWGADGWGKKAPAALQALMQQGLGIEASGPVPAVVSHGLSLRAELELACLRDGAEGAVILLYGFIRPATRLHAILQKGLSDLGIPDDQLAFLRLDTEPLERALGDIINAANGSTTPDRWRAAVSSVLDQQVRLHDGVYTGMQLFGITRMLERIQDRKTLMSGPTDACVHHAGQTTTPLYHNKIDKHQIDFSVHSLQFRPEVLEARLVHIPPQKNNEHHRHAHETVFYIIRGHGRILVDDSHVEVGPGDIVFVPRWAMHQSQNKSDEEMQILAVTDFGLTGKTFIGDYAKTSRMVHYEQSGAANWRVLRAESKATEDYFAPLSVAHGTDPDVWTNPYGIYKKARSEAPICYSERFSAWFVTRHADVGTLLRETRLSSRRADEKFRGFEGEALKRMESFHLAMRQWLQFLDPPDHTAVRSRMNPFFLGPAIEAMRPRVESIVNELVDSIEANGQGDLIWDLASPMHFILMAEMFAGETMDRALLKMWSMEIWSFAAGGTPAADRSERAAQSWKEMTDYLREFIVARRASPRDDIFSAMLKPDAKGQVLSEDAVIQACLSVISVGHEATWDTIGNGWAHLLQQPETLARLKASASPKIIPQAVEELLRYDAPGQVVSRKALEPFTVAGKQIEKGDFLFLVIGAANRDPEFYERPDDIDFTRSPKGTLATGAGVHNCVGGVLGKVESQTVMSTLLRRLPNMRLAAEKLLWKPNLGLRGVLKLPVSC
jgi:cytochrome P450/mannose-6-phosphate isomerase-like protein (cupin superfamily)